MKTSADRHFDVVVVGGRIAGATAAIALAPYAESILLLERSKLSARWLQQASWDRVGALMWDQLGLLGTVLGCGASPVRSHTLRMDDVLVTYGYPDADEHCYRMCVSRELLDPALIEAAARTPRVMVLRPAMVRELLAENGRVRQVRFRHDGQLRSVSAGLVVLAAGRASPLIQQVGAQPYLRFESPWLTLISYRQGLALPDDRAFYSRQRGTMMSVMSSGPSLWCLSVTMHRDLLDSSGIRPRDLYTETLQADPDVGPALAGSRAVSPVGGAGRLAMTRRPMAGPGWCLVGDSGYHVDPLVGMGTRNALTSVNLLRDWFAATRGGQDYQELTARRDALFEADWVRATEMMGYFAPTAAMLGAAAALAGDPAAATAEIARQMRVAA